MTPRLSWLGDRERIAAALSEDERRALYETCDDLGVPRDRWPRVPGMRSWVELVAWTRETETVRRAIGCSWTRAEAEAAVRLGLNLDTLRSRLAAWNRAVGLDSPVAGNGTGADVRADSDTD